MRPGRIVAAVVVAAGVVFGAFGGEYSTPDRWELKRRVTAERAALERLASQLDSLAAYADSIERDSAVQERVAREKIGMMRSGEILYRLEPVQR